MSEEQYNKIKNYNIKDICEKDEFGVLKFTSSLELLEKIRKIILDIYELGYEDLTPNEKGNVNNLIWEFENAINRIVNFNLNISNPGDEKRSIEDYIVNMNNNYLPWLRWVLSYLKQENASKYTDKKEFDKQLKAIWDMKKKLEDSISQYSIKINEFEEKKQLLDRTGTDLSNTQLSIYFSETYINYNNKSYWRKVSMWIFYWVLFILIFVLVISQLSETKWIEIKSREAWLSILSLISVLFYGVTFCSRHYNIIKNIAEVNKHRSNVAETVWPYLINDSISPEIKSNLLWEATKTMFWTSISWYLSKNDSPTASSPALDFISRLLIK